MATKRQIEANRRNAKKSTGPKTPAGKARSARNALKHGLTSRQVVLEDESAELFEELRRNLQEDLRPGSQLELLLVNRLAAVQWRLGRVPALEAELFGRLRAEPTGGDDSLGVAWERDVGPYGGALGRLVRYETALERSASRLLAELRRLQSQRAKDDAAVMREAQARVNARHNAPPAMGSPAMRPESPKEGTGAFSTGPASSRAAGSRAADSRADGPDGGAWWEEAAEDSRPAYLSKVLESSTKDFMPSSDRG